MCSMKALATMQAEGHEQVVFFHDRATGLRAIVAIHSTRLGPALGGCRMWPYPDEDQAIHDVLRLSKAMTYKNAAMDLPLGGGKAVIIGDPRTDKTPELFEAFGRCLERLGGAYITAEDVGTSPQDMLAVQRMTTHVAGLPGKSGDPSPATAFGVYNGIKACLAHVYGDETIAGRRVAVQGLGAVGWHLCEHLHADGAHLIVADIFADKVQRAVERFGAVAVEPDAIYEVDCDVFAPCALGGVINDDTVMRLKARIVAGSANNQLAEARHAGALRERGILYAPDFIINGGGVINVAAELAPGGYDRERAYRQVAEIRNKVARAIHIAEERGITTHEAAILMAKARLERREASMALASE